MRSRRHADELGETGIDLAPMLDFVLNLLIFFIITTSFVKEAGISVERPLAATAEHKVSTPVNWQQGEDVIIAGSVSDEEAKELFGDWQAPKPYIRIVPQPG